MKILHLISSGGMYGAEAVILNLSAELNREGQHTSALGVFLHSSNQIPELHKVASGAGLRSSLVPCLGQLDLSVPSRLRALAEEEGADVIHAHGYKADVYAYLAFRQHRRALVSTCHTWYDNDLAVRIYGAADRWVLRSYDEVIAVSPEVQARLLGAGAKADRVHLIRNGIDVGPFEDAEAKRLSRNQEGMGLNVGLVGRLAPEKGIDVFLRAAALLFPKVPSVRFSVAGEGPERSTLERLLV
ncbi:MAG TPA: glycosyltransferase, partial [Acidobacteriaceae bacterium]|nr:glycosyltransferase [Acidobacteriaceae bacterium]